MTTYPRSLKGSSTAEELVGEAGLVGVLMSDELVPRTHLRLVLVVLLVVGEEVREAHGE